MRSVFLILLAAALLLSSCTYLRSIKDAAREEPEIKTDKKASIDKDPQKQVAALVSKEDYEAALELIRSEIKKGRKEQGFATLYVKSENGLMQEGMALYESGECYRAGKIFRKALYYMPSERDMRSAIMLSSEDLTVYIDECSDKLMEMGLMEYRRGNLGKAVEVWEGIIQFNPNHERAKKAIETATVQLKNLKKIESH